MQEDIEIDFASIQINFIKIEEEFSNIKRKNILTLVLESADCQGV